MASRSAVGDPLRGGGAFDDQDMEDLTAHLANLPTGRSSHDGLDIGDNSELLQGNMDRFRALAGDDPHDDLFTSYGGMGLGLGMSGLDPSASTIITTTNYPTYGELAAASGKPPSYEDSVMYEQAPPLGMLLPPPQGGELAPEAAGAVAGPLAAAAGTPLLGDPLTDGGGGRASAGGSGPLSPGGMGPLGLGPANGGAALGSLSHPSSAIGPLGSPTAAPQGQPAMAPSFTTPAAPAPSLAAAAAAARPAASHVGTSAGGSAASAAPSSSAGVAAAAAAAAAAALDSLAIPGTTEFREEDLGLSPQSSTPINLGLPPTPGPAGRSHQHQHHLHITVSDPIKREQGGLFGLKGGYVTYLVRAKGRVNGQARPETTVRRRFREFVSLAELLKEKYRGYFVPPRPEKNAVEGQRMTDAFVEERRLALERYLNKLARHPVIGASEELRLFLEADGELADCAAWLALRPLSLGGSVLDGTARFSKQILGLDRAVTDPVQAAQPTKKATDFMRAIKETARSMQNPTAAQPPEEVSLQRCKEEVEGLQTSLTTASRAAEKLVARLDRWAVVHGELGLAMFQLRKAEQADGGALAQHTGTLKQSGTIMHDTERLGTALVRSSRIGRKVTGRCAIELGCLHEYLGMMPAALKGLRAREKALLTADTLQADLEARRKSIADLEVAGAKVLGGDAAKAKKVADLNGDVAVLEQSISAARAQYERIRGVNQAEVGRLHSELRTDLGSMLGHYAAIMSACAQRNAEIWLHAASELQATPEQLQAAKAPLMGGLAVAGGGGGGGGGGGAGVAAAQPAGPSSSSSGQQYPAH